MQDAEQVSAGQPVSVLASVCREDSYGSEGRGWRGPSRAEACQRDCL